MKRLISSLLTAGMICGMSAHAFADSCADNAAGVLSSVKDRIAISADYDTFSSDSYTDENGTECMFSWENGGKSIEVTANESGIISAYLYTDGDDASMQSQSEKPAPQDVLYKAACAYANRLNPDIYGKLKISGGTISENCSVTCKMKKTYTSGKRWENMG